MAQTDVLIMDAGAMDRALSRMAHEMIERNPNMKEVALIGIQRRGVPLSKRLVERIAQYTGVWPDWGSLDISFYRDDLSLLAELPILKGTNVLFPLRGRTVILVYDVLYTGKTARAAIDAIIDLGRPRAIQFAALIDREHRELPIRADFVGKNVPTSNRELINVCVSEIDGKDEVVLTKETESL